MLLARSVSKCMYCNMVLLNIVLTLGVVYTCDSVFVSGTCHMLHW